MCWSLEVGAHKDSGWDPRPQELTKRRGVLESRGRPRSPSGGERRPSAESVRRRAEAIRGGRPRSPSAGERRPSAESVRRRAEAVRGVRRSAWASQLWGGQGCYHQRLMGRGQGCGPRVRNPGPGENQGDREADGTQKWLCP